MRPFALTLAALLAAPTAQAATYTLDFSGPICLDGSTSTPDDVTTCSNGSNISQAYGDQPGVDVVYDGSPNEGNSPLSYWATAYSDLIGVAWSQAGSTISFLAGTGYEVGLTSLKLGSWPFTTRDAAFTITDLSDNATLFDSGVQTILGTTASVFDFDVKSTTGLKITFLLEFNNVGVDDIVYSPSLIDPGGTDPENPVDPTDPTDPSVIPLPASAVLLLGALGGLGVLRRRTSRI